MDRHTLSQACASAGVSRRGRRTSGSGLHQGKQDRWGDGTKNTIPRRLRKNEKNTRSQDSPRTCVLGRGVALATGCFRRRCKQRVRRGRPWLSLGQHLLNVSARAVISFQNSLRSAYYVLDDRSVCPSRALSGRVGPAFCVQMLRQPPQRARRGFRSVCYVHECSGVWVSGATTSSGRT
ncbi:hypothetical protein BV22DRAFT_737514 [Leucogyrophana mollusca]|uniref:Uncharacterized protein n=1 Tax=Leucogyrophana mollusca TaxID=85980 RepID=A0ACB8B6B7_9AGAM|nr:hypothetical protein BV22DRAFT_737514 [Leucogyrophana mollusca]